MGKKGARKGTDDDEIFGAAIIGFATGTLTQEFDRRGESNGSNRHDFDL